MLLNTLQLLMQAGCNLAELTGKELENKETS